MNQVSQIQKMGGLSRFLLFVAGILLVISIFVPMWRIELDAPQYPEGLCLQIYTYKLGGNVDIINGLNHYIGMNTLHTEDFIEFTVLPFIISFFALASFAVALAARRKLLKLLLGAFILFGIVAMVDFWRWEYEYGHNLDPNAAIIVPGMAYQPPLIGFKQLLNFGAYSIPDMGGWLFIASGLLMLVAVVIEFKAAKKQAIAGSLLLALLGLGLQGCVPAGPEPIRINRDQCVYCKMSISDIRFAAQAITDKGKVYKFDDLACLRSLLQEQNGTFSRYYAAGYLPPHHLLPVEQLAFIRGTGLQSPMGGNTAAFTDDESAGQYLEKYSAEPVSWDQILEPTE
jgi:copper chaperone NosL